MRKHKYGSKVKVMKNMFAFSILIFHFYFLSFHENCSDKEHACGMNIKRYISVNLG